MGPRAVLDAVVKRKIPNPAGIRTPIIRASSPWSIATTRKIMRKRERGREGVKRKAHCNGDTKGIWMKSILREVLKKITKIM
jgi:hypothetical protein